MRIHSPGHAKSQASEPLPSTGAGVPWVGGCDAVAVIGEDWSAGGLRVRPTSGGGERSADGVAAFSDVAEVWVGDGPERGALGLLPASAVATSLE